MADIVYPGDTPGGTLGLEFLPGNYDLVIYRGDYFPISVTVRDSNDVPLNLTGYTAKAVVKPDYASATTYSFTSTITEGTGKVDLVLPSAVSATLIPGPYIWDFQLTDPSGNVRTYIAGDVTVYDEVSK
jgi:hypothetical protein